MLLHLLSHLNFEILSNRNWTSSRIYSMYWRAAPSDISKIQKIETKVSVLAHSKVNKTFLHFPEKSSIAFLFYSQIRAIETHNVEFISGSRRTPEGKWHLNCFQTDYKNYSLKISAGYFKSTEDSCLLCDFSQGPFLTKTSTLQNLKFEPKFSGSPLSSIDFFIKVRQILKSYVKSLVMNFELFFQAKYVQKGILLNCPDTMSNVVEDSLIFKE